jgi:hypothetical protein
MVLAAAALLAADITSAHPQSGDAGAADRGKEAESEDRGSAG